MAFKKQFGEIQLKTFIQLLEMSALKKCFNGQEDTEPTNKSAKLHREEINFRLDSMIENQRKSLECPVCFHIPRFGPVYGCRNGHFLCQECQKSVNKCPICRDLDLNCRQLMVESMVRDIDSSGLKIKCKNDYCNVDGNLKDIFTHEHILSLIHI